jgi:hypothetical protein
LAWNFIPLRDKNLNWSKVVDGTTSATQWKGLHEVSETVHSITLLMVGCKAIPHPIQLLVLKVRKRSIYLIWHRMEKVLEGKCSSFIEQRRKIL